MTKNIQFKLNFAAVLAGLLTAGVITTAFASPAFADWQAQKTLANNCLSARFSADSEKNVFFDPETRVVNVETFAPGQDEGSSVILPYQPETGFSGCSRDAKELLTRVKENQERYISDTCKEMRAIVAGQKPLPEKDGRKANMPGAVQFVKERCGK